MPEPVVRRGPLIFKGETKAPVRRISSESVKVKKIVQSESVTKPCEGRIVSNGLTIQGLETQFKDELEIGDVIIVKHPQSLQIEERVVTEIISQRSLSINRPFSSDFVSTTDFSVRTNLQDPKIKSEQGQDRAETAASSERSVLTYKKRAGPWGYMTVTEELDRKYSEEELLDMRCKKSHDRYC
jgi:hypothetical protein